MQHGKVEKVSGIKSPKIAIGSLLIQDPYKLTTGSNLTKKKIVDQSFKAIRQVVSLHAQTNHTP